MAKFCGKDLLLEIWMGAVPSFVVVAAMRSTSFTLNEEQVDVTDKGSERWRELIECGIKTMSVTAAGPMENAASLREILSAKMNGPSIRLFRITSGMGDEFQGEFQIASIERTGEYNGSEDYSLTLESSGVIAYTPADPVPAVVAPVNDTLPAITGTTEVGQTLSTTQGEWSGSVPMAFSYQWLRDGVAIPGANFDTYLLVGDDEGADISCAVTATNDAASVTATSAEVGPITT